jgi:hypothetical protein
MKRILAIIFVIFFVSCAPIINPAPTETPIHVETANLIPPTVTNTLSPTATFTPTTTPIPDVNLESFVFPYDVPQVVAVWKQSNLPSQYRYFTYHITDRLDKSLNPDDPCGYHPGDAIIPIGSTKALSGFVIDVRMPYTAKLKNSWVPGGGGEAFTFFIGQSKGKSVYLDMYHTTSSSFSKTEWIMQGEVFGVLSQTMNYGGWNEAKVHFTLFNPSPSGGTDLRQGATAIPLAPIALPPTLEQMFINNTKLLIIYQGDNWCNMKSAQKINTILEEYLPNAGFCVDGSKVSYCDKNDLFQGITFTQAKYDERSVMLTPVNR